MMLPFSFNSRRILRSASERHSLTVRSSNFVAYAMSVQSKPSRKRSKNIVRSSSFIAWTAFHTCLTCSWAKTWNAGELRSIGVPLLDVEAQRGTTGELPDGPNSSVPYQIPLGNLSRSRFQCASLGTHCGVEEVTVTITSRIYNNPWELLVHLS